MFLEDFEIFFEPWPLLVSPRCGVSVYTMANQTQALQQNLQTSEKSQHFKENTIFNEHPVYYNNQILFNENQQFQMTLQLLAQQPQ